MSSSLNAPLIGAFPARIPDQAPGLPEHLLPAKGLLLGIAVSVGFWVATGIVVVELLG